MNEDCKHYWIANSGNGGKPVYRVLGGILVMHVKCGLCNCRTWFTEEQWNDVPVIQDPRKRGQKMELKLIMAVVLVLVIGLAFCFEEKM